MLRSLYRAFPAAAAEEKFPAWQQRLARIAASQTKVDIPLIPEKEKVDLYPGLVPVQPVKGSVRSGLVGYKIGHIGLYDEWGQKHLTTVVKVHDCYVTRMKTIANSGYEAVQLSTGCKEITKATKTELGQCIKLGIRPKDHQCEFRVSSENLLPVGMKMSVRHFVPGQWVFVSGKTKPKGYQGVKRSWGMSGQPKTHGTTKGENNAGSTGQGKGVGKVWKYKKMDGHRGPDPRVVNCKIFKTETHRDLIFLRGIVPGAIGDVVKMYDARGKTALKNRHIKLPFPTFVPKEGVDYPVTVQQPPLDRDPFLFPDKVIKEKRVKAYTLSSLNFQVS